MKKTDGLTLVELIIAAFILGLLLLLIGSGLQSSSKAVGLVMGETELLEDIRASGQMITDELSRAVYVYPPGTPLSLNSSDSATVINPNTGDNTWTVGTDPILAFVQGPDDPLKECSSSNEACIYFVAYYAMQRSGFVSSLVPEDKAIIQDDAHEDSWVLLEYRKKLSENRLAANTPPPTSSSSLLALKQSEGHLVADYLVAGSGFTAFSGTTHTCRSRQSEEAQTCNGLDTSTVDYRETALSGEFQLQASQTRGSTTTTTPVLTFPIAPRAIYSFKE